MILVIGDDVMIMVIGDDDTYDANYNFSPFTRSRRQVAPRRPVVKAPCCKPSAMQWDNNSECVNQV